jgi:hypothetical protein
VVVTMKVCLLVGQSRVAVAEVQGLFWNPEEDKCLLLLTKERKRHSTLSRFSVCHNEL